MSTAIARLLARTAAVALLLALIAGAAQIVVMPIAAHIETLRERIDQERLMLGRLASMQASTEQLSERDAAARAARTASLFLEGESDAIRLANLQSLLADIAAKTGAKLRSTRTVSPRASPPGVKLFQRAHPRVAPRAPVQSAHGPLQPRVAPARQWTEAAASLDSAQRSRYEQRH